MARLPFLRKSKSDGMDAGQPAPRKGAGSAGILAARLGLGRSKNADMKAIAAPDGSMAMPSGSMSLGAFGFPMALALSLLLLAGVAGWLALSAESTLRHRGELVSRLTLPVLLPDGSLRFPEIPVEEAEPEKEPDPVDLPVTLSASRLDGLLEKTRGGYLPRVAVDGQAPWQAYARPFPHDDPRPRIALVMTDLGQSRVALDTAVARLPGAVTFAFAANAGELQKQIDEARRNGHEVLLSVPMEPVGFPLNDPGPGTLLTALPDERNVERLEAAMASVTGYVGLTSTTGSKFTASRPSLQAVLYQVQRRGLAYVDSWLVPDSQATRLSTILGLPRAIADARIDRVPSANGIDAQLAELERLAKANGAAVGFAQPYPVTIERIARWSASLRDRGIVLAPVTAVLNKQADR